MISAKVLVSRSPFVGLACLFLVACSGGSGGNPAGAGAGSPAPTGSAAGAPSGSGSGAASAAAAPAGGVGCYEVSQCAASCADSDDACNNACIAKGTDQAKTLVTALTSCAQQHACADSTCLTTSCGSEIEACRNDHTPSPAPAAGSGAGSVPAELVGTWSVQSGAATIVDTFNADGSYHELSGLSTGEGCPLVTSFDIQGTAAFAASTVTFNQVSGTQATQSCSSDKSTTPITPKSETKSWILEGGVLYTWTADCQDYHSCAIRFTKSS